MKKLLLVLAFAGLFNLVQGQRPHCFTSEYHNEEIQRNPQYKKNLEDLEKFTAHYIQTKPLQRSSSVVYIIPVVFHILHDYGSENVTDEVIRQALASINEDYRKLNADTDQVIVPFKSIVADCEMEFRLATIDPNGIVHLVLNTSQR